MNRTIVFTLRVTSVERQIISKLASQLRRSQSDAIRYILMEAAQQLLTNNEDIHKFKASLTNKDQDEKTHVNFQAIIGG